MISAGKSSERRESRRETFFAASVERVEKRLERVFRAVRQICGIARRTRGSIRLDMVSPAMPTRKRARGSSTVLRTTFWLLQ
jgi:hypothetical protein